jgi:hypothetical protein
VFVGNRLLRAENPVQIQVFAVAARLAQIPMHLLVREIHRLAGGFGLAVFGLGTHANIHAR